VDEEQALLLGQDVRHRPVELVGLLEALDAAVPDGVDLQAAQQTEVEELAERMDAAGRDAARARDVAADALEIAHGQDVSGQSREELSAVVLVLQEVEELRHLALQIGFELVARDAVHDLADAPPALLRIRSVGAAVQRRSRPMIVMLRGVPNVWR
jgi:hypothetical protein